MRTNTVERTNGAASIADNDAMRIFVFLGHGFGARIWEERWRQDGVPGCNERLPYGYFHAGGVDCEITYSEDGRENSLTRLARRGLRRAVGFDFIHAWRNRESLMKADVVWTYTELEHLAALLLWRQTGNKNKPKLIAQSVWLYDRWPRLSPWRQRFYKWLLQGAEILAVQSLEGVEYARRIFPKKQVEWLPFGTSARVTASGESRLMHTPVRVASLGNDVDRDWQALLTAVGDMSCRVRIASTQLRLAADQIPAHVVIERPRTAAEISELYQWADVVAVSLRPNLHASGITTICEAILAGLPVVCTDVGGLRAYFSDLEVRYVPPVNPRELRAALEETAGSDPKSRYEMVSRAQQRIEVGGFTSAAFARQNYELSKGLLNKNTRREQ
jgi:glycosyltransferase involved in cell wall biosynthesis